MTILFTLDPANGGPGIDPRWTRSDKDGVGTAYSALSRVWFTVSKGILNEVYSTRPSTARRFATCNTSSPTARRFSMTNGKWTTFTNISPPARWGIASPIPIRADDIAS